MNLRNSYQNFKQLVHNLLHHLTKSKSQGSFELNKTKVFKVVGKDIYIGGELVNERMRDILRGQAQQFQTTNLYEILDATITDEAYRLALNESGKSGNIEQDVRFAKALYHWNHVLKNIIHALAK